MNKMHREIILVQITDHLAKVLNLAQSLDESDPLANFILQTLKAQFKSLTNLSLRELKPFIHDEPELRQ